MFSRGHNDFDGVYIYERFWGCVRDTRWVVNSCLCVCVRVCVCDEHVYFMAVLYCSVYSLLLSGNTALLCLIKEQAET